MRQIQAGYGLLLFVFLAPVRADLHFPQTTVKLAEVGTGQPLRQRFEFTNRGPSVVVISRLDAVCGCMTPRLDKREYQPGESGSFTLEINTLTQPVGANSWHVRVDYRDGDQARTQDLHLQATLRAEIKVEPPRLALSTQGAPVHDVLVTDQRPLPFHVTQAQTSSTYLTARVQLEAGGRSFRIHLEVKPELPEGTHEEMLSIFTDDPGCRELRVPVTIQKHSRTAISPTPATVNLTIPRGQPAPSRVVLLRGKSDEAVLVDRIEVDNPALQCRWSAGPGKMATLRVSVAQGSVADVLRGTMRVHFSKPSTASVSIPVTCMVR
jgi:hypothetical protein